MSSSATVIALFLASGATSLIYQVIWTRWFGLLFGTTTTSIAIVLGAFMCGLALGSALVARRVSVIARPLRAYAACELGIGVFALAFPLVLRLVEALYLVIDDGTGGPPLLFFRAVLSFALLCVPTGLMGATLPLLTEHFKRNPMALSSWRVGILYAANTIGAASGIILAGFILIELLGISTTTALAALGNGLVAAVAWRIDRGSAPAPLPTPVAGTANSPDLRWVSIALATTGCLALATEVLWTRVLSSYLGTSTYAFSTIVCTYLVGIALGSALMAHLVRRIDDVRGALLGVVLLAGGLHTLSIEVFLYLAGEGDLPRGPQIPVLDILILYGKFALLLMPTAIASGACFPLATRILNPNDEDADGALVARAYAANTWGSVAGSVLAGFGIAASFDMEPSLRVIAGGYVTAVVLGAVALRARARHASAVGAVALVLTVAIGGRALTRPSFQTHLETTTEHTLLRHEPGVQGLTTVINLADYGPSLFVNHHGMTVKITDTKMMAHLAMFLHPRPEDTLVICFGMGTTFRSAMSHGGRVTVVELVPAVADSFEFFHDDAAQIRADQRGRILVGDGRHYLKATHERFDVITMDPPPPIDGEGVNNLYSRDFAELARDRLKPGGIAMHWVPLPATGAGIDDEEGHAMVVESFAGAFPHVRTVVGINRVGVHVLGSMEPIVVNDDLLRTRLEERPEAAKDLNEYQEVPRSFLSSGGAYRAESAPPFITTDDRPLLEFYLLRTLSRNNSKSLGGHLWLP